MGDMGVEPESASQSIDLPKGTANESPLVAEVLNFDSVVASSTQKIEEAAAAQVKRPVGRPPGSKKKKNVEESSSATSDAASEESNASLRNLTQELEPVLKDAVKTPFSLAAKHFENPALEVSDADAKTPAYYLSQWLRLSIPEIEKQGPKAFNLYAFLLSMVLLVIRKIPKTVKPSVRPNSNVPVKSVTAEVVGENLETHPSPPLTTSPLPSRHEAQSAGAFFTPKGSREV